jgi:hypothetical protein
VFAASRSRDECGHTSRDLLNSDPVPSSIVSLVVAVDIVEVLYQMLAATDDCNSNPLIAA